MTIRLLPETIERLSDIERYLRRAGLRARKASASEIVDALVCATTPAAVYNLLSDEPE